MSKKPAKKTSAQSDSADSLMEGVPRVNIGALFLPPVWGPAHGIWVAIVFYPLWLVADTCFVNAFVERTPLALGLGSVVFVALTAVHIGFAVISQRYALHRTVALGRTKEAYLKRQRIWAVVGVVAGLAMIALATYYNLAFNPRIVG